MGSVFLASFMGVDRSFFGGGIVSKKWYSEENLIDNVARFVPWLAPGIPATFAYINSSTVLLMDWPIAILIALTIEGLGLASVHTALSLVEFIKTHKKNQPKTEAKIMAGMTLFYLSIEIGRAHV